MKVLQSPLCSDVLLSYLTRFSFCHVLKLLLLKCKSRIPEYSILDPPLKGGGLVLLLLDKGKGFYMYFAQNSLF